MKHLSHIDRQLIQQDRRIPECAGDLYSTNLLWRKLRYQFSPWFLTTHREVPTHRVLYHNSVTRPYGLRCNPSGSLCVGCFRPEHLLRFGISIVHNAIVPQSRKDESSVSNGTGIRAG